MNNKNILAGGFCELSHVSFALKYNLISPSAAHLN